MELAGSRVIAADRATIWAHLTSANTLKACIPGCEALTGNAQEGFEAVVKQKVGPVKATFRGGVTLCDIVEAESYTITGEGKGGVAGFAKGAAKIMLTEVEDGVELSYGVDAQVGGKLAQLGSRVINGFARKMVDAFFENFQGVVEGRDTDGGGTAAG